MRLSLPTGKKSENIEKLSYKAFCSLSNVLLNVTGVGDLQLQWLIETLVFLISIIQIRQLKLRIDLKVLS